MKPSTWQACGVLWLCLGGGPLGCDQARASDEIVVGVVLDYSGSETADGFLIERSALLAAELIGRERQGAHPFRLSFQNARGRPDIAEQGARQLIEQGALAVLGPSSDGLTEAVGATLRDADVLLVSPTATTGLDYDAVRPWVRMSPGNSTGSSAATLFGENLAKSLLERDVNRVGVLVGSDLYDREFATAFAQTYERLGGASMTWPVTDATSVQSAAREILNDGDALQGYVLALELLVAAKVVTEVAAVRPDPAAWFLTPRLKSELLIVNTPPNSLNRALGVSPLITSVREECDSRLPDECFSSAYHARWDDNPPDEAYFMYDAAAVLLMALDRLQRMQTETPSRAQIMEQILEIAARGGVQVGWNDFAAAADVSSGVQYVGVTGPIILDPDGTRRSGNTSLWRIEGGRIVNDSD